MGRDMYVVTYLSLFTVKELSMGEVCLDWLFNFAGAQVCGAVDEVVFREIAHN